MVVLTRKSLNWHQFEAFRKNINLAELVNPSTIKLFHIKKFYLPSVIIIWTCMLAFLLWLKATECPL